MIRNKNDFELFMENYIILPITDIVSSYLSVSQRCSLGYLVEDAFQTISTELISELPEILKNKVVITQMKTRKIEGYIHNIATNLWENGDNKKINSAICAAVIEYLRENFCYEIENNIFAKLAKYVHSSQFKEETILKLYNKCYRNFEFDVDGDCDTLSIKNGKLINLKYLEMRDREGRDYFTKESPCTYLPHTGLTEMNNFFGLIIGGDIIRLREFRKCLGYIITGDICHGDGFAFVGYEWSRKLICKILEKLLGDFCWTTPYKDFEKGCRQNSYYIEKSRENLIGKRLVQIMDQNGEGFKSDGFVKNIIKRATMVGTRRGGEHINFQIYCKIIIDINNEQKFKKNNPFHILNRLEMIRFPDIQGLDINIDEMINGRLDEIFTWICHGAHDWYIDKRIHIDGNMAK